MVNEIILYYDARSKKHQNTVEPIVFGNSTRDMPITKLYRCTFKCPVVQNDMLTSIHKHRCCKTVILCAHVLLHPDNAYVYARLPGNTVEDMVVLKLLSMLVMKLMTEAILLVMYFRLILFAKNKFVHH